MGKKLFFMILFITVMNSFASGQLISVVDVLSIDNSVKESIEIDFVEMPNGTAIQLPTGAYDIQINGEDVSNSSIELHCLSCNISFAIDNIVKQDKSTFTFVRTLNLLPEPDVLDYTIILPPGFTLDNPGEEPPVAPIGEVRTDGENIQIHWFERNAELPKVYLVRYREIESNLIWIAGLAILCLAIGGMGGYFLRAFRKKDVPAALLNPDEQAVMKVVEESSGEINQREIVRKTGWSRSKVSGVLSNLDFKKIVQREKIGRNYKVRLVKKLGK